MKKIVFFLLMLLLAFLSFAGQVTVPALSDEEQSELQFIIGRIELADGQLRLVDKQGVVLYSESINHVRSIVLSGEAEGFELLPVSVLTVYPNPTTAMLHIQGIEEDTNWRVYDMQGRLVKQGTGAQVPVDALGQGDYLLQVKSYITKFIKQ